MTFFIEFSELFYLGWIPNLYFTMHQHIYLYFFIFILLILVSFKLLSIIVLSLVILYIGRSRFLFFKFL